MRRSAGGRRFLMGTAGWLAAAGAAKTGVGFQAEVEVDPQAKLKGTRRMIPIIDTHQHLWDLTIFRLPWQKDNAKLARSFLTRDYLEATAGLNVVKSIYMEVDVEPSPQPAQADHVIALCPPTDPPTPAPI